MDDDYLNIYEYVGEEKHEYTAATNISKEEHEMKKNGISTRNSAANTIANQPEFHWIPKASSKRCFQDNNKGYYSLTADNTSITSVATTVENITSQLSTQLDETNNSITSVHGYYCVSQLMYTVIEPHATNRCVCKSTVCIKKPQ